MRFGFDCNDEKYGTLRAGPSLWGVTLPCILGVFGKDGSGSNLNVQNSWANEALAVVVQFEVLRLDTRNRETGIYLQSTASRSRGMATDIQEKAANIGEIRIYTRRTAARSRGMAETAHFPLFPPDLPKTMPVSETKAAYFCKGKFPVLDTAKRVLKLRRK